MALSSRDYFKAAKQRFVTAEFLLQNGYNLDALYLAEYAVEYSLKALILEATPEFDRPTTLREISQGHKMHSPEVLAGVLDERLGRPVPGEIRKRFRRFDWATSLRYESGRK